MLADFFKTAGKFDCLKSKDVLSLEELQYTPFHLIALCLLVAAIIHTLCVDKIHSFARSLEAKQAPKRISHHFHRGIGVQMLYFLAEVEIVFAIWAIPLFLFMAGFKGWHVAIEYINTRDYTEALFVVIVLSLASTKPIIQCAQRIIHVLARGLGGSLSAWWFTLLTVGPLLGSFITEAGAMAISAVLLSKEFYHFRPSSKLAYATLALLFTNISVGGVLTNFASPAVLVLSHAWHWSNWEVFTAFGWKAIFGILIANSIYWFYFRKEFAHLNKRRLLASEVFNAPAKDEPVPWWIVGIHLFFLAIIVLSSHYPAIFIASYLFFIGMYQATRQHQCALKLARPLLVGLFLAGLVIHGGLQGWWVVQMLKDLDPIQVLGMAMGLTAFNDNTAISYLATLIPDWSHAYQYALFTGVIAGGGLTVIANAPNPAGFVILAGHFGGSVSSFKLAIAALIPAAVFYLIFSLFGPLFL
jgi:hypothetical protein